MKVLRTLVKLSAVLVLAFWPVSTFAAAAIGDTGTACDAFGATLGPTASTSPISDFVLAPSVNSTVVSGSTETICLPSAQTSGDVVAVLDFTPANQITNNAFSNGNQSHDAFSIDVRQATTNGLVTHWTPDQCHPGHAVFTLSAAQLRPSNGPFLLDVKNFSPFDVGYSMTVSGPGAVGIPGADTSLSPTQNC